jgi:fatty acid desaturase
MSAYKAVAIMNSVMWLACGLAVAVAVYSLKSAGPLWALLIPALAGYGTKDKTISDK